jgi:putative acetyltransferase
MSLLKRTTSADMDFQNLVHLLDKDLQIRDGEEHSFYAQFNKIDSIKNVVVYYEENDPIGCGAFKQWQPSIAEIKRMFVKPEHRSKGIASVILNELENWAAESGFSACVLETGKKQPEAIRLYTKNNYTIIPNFGQYENVENSVCMKKIIAGQS